MSTNVGAVDFELLLNSNPFNKGLKSASNNIKSSGIENSLKSIGIFMCLNTGLRVGEICALKWENIDIGKKTIQVKKTLQRIYVDQKKTRVIIDNPKTVKSVRTIPISNKFLGLFFTSITGKFLKLEIRLIFAGFL